jgi:glycosyltransferase involved in cell wall biosynthesis
MSRHSTPHRSRALVVIPTYQESANIAEVLGGVRAAAPEADVLVVDDASPDGTAELAERAGRELGGISVLRRPGKSGLGAAYRAGFAYGLDHGYDILVEMDADLSHDPASLPDLLGAVADGADLAVGSRYVPGGRIPDWPLRRRLLSRGGNRYARWALHLGAADATSGYRAFRASTLRAVACEATRATGYGFQIELTHRVTQWGGTIVEVPIAFHDRTRGRSKMSLRITAEAFGLVTWWAIRDRLHAAVPRHGTVERGVPAAA